MNKLSYIVQDPDVYYTYYQNKYNITLDTIKSLEKKGIPPENLILLRTKLAELAGEMAVVIGIIHHKDLEDLQYFWKLIHYDKENASKSFKNIEEYEKNIIYIQQECLK